jgi:DNA polymerase-3 subunit delta
MLVAPTADKRKRMYKACDKSGIVVECPQLDDRALSTWIQENLSERGLTIDATAITALISRVGGKLSDMVNALTLLTNFVS